jgi:ketosteroid isomerase-like protein
LPGLSISWQPTEVVIARSGDIAYVVGTYSLSFKSADSKPQTDQGKLLGIWKKQSDGTWKCSADTWNLDLPAR